MWESPWDKCIQIQDLLSDALRSGLQESDMKGMKDNLIYDVLPVLDDQAKIEFAISFQYKVYDQYPIPYGCKWEYASVLYVGNILRMKQDMIWEILILVI